MKKIEFTKEELEEINEAMSECGVIINAWFGSEDYNISSRYSDHKRIVKEFYEAKNIIIEKLKNN